MNIKFITPYLFEIEGIRGYNIKYEPNFSYTKIDTIDSEYQEELQYVLPSMIHFWAFGSLPKNTYYSIYFWKKDDRYKAYYYHSNTNYSNIGYWREYSLKEELPSKTSAKKLDHSQKIYLELFTSPIIAIDSKGYVKKFINDNNNTAFTNFIDFILKESIKRENEINQRIKEIFA